MIELYTKTLHSCFTVISEHLDKLYKTHSTTPTYQALAQVNTVLVEELDKLAHK